MKTCTNCKVSKKRSQFNRRTRSSDGLQSWCKSCTNEQYRKTYPEKCQYIRKRNKQNCIDYRNWLDSLVTGPCTDCGIDLGKLPPSVGQWDHMPGHKKELTIGNTRKSVISKKRVLKELNKCELVCANCHSLRSTLRLTPAKVEAWLASLDAGTVVPQRHTEGIDISKLDLVITPPHRGSGPILDSLDS